MGELYRLDFASEFCQRQQYKKCAPLKESAERLRADRETQRLCMPSFSPETLWGSQFGDDYHARSPGSVEANTAFFELSLRKVPEVRSVLEFGAGVGNNLRALRVLYQDVSMAAVEVNTEACLQQPDNVIPYLMPISAFHETRTWELTLSKGFLIHVQPEEIADAYDKLYRYSSRYILICEYFSVQRTMIPYRGTTDTLWKADFGGEMLDRFPDLKLLDYGFVSRRDPVMAQDDLNFWTFEKK